MKLNQLENKLNKLGINYKVEKGEYYSYITFEKGPKISIKEKERIKRRGEIYCSSVADRYESVLEIVDVEKYDSILAYIKDRGYSEVSNWYCAQWGTWKFIIADMGLLSDLHSHDYI